MQYPQGAQQRGPIVLRPVLGIAAATAQAATHGALVASLNQDQWQACPWTCLRPGVDFQALLVGHDQLSKRIAGRWRQVLAAKQLRIAPGKAQPPIAEMRARQP